MTKKIDKDSKATDMLVTSMVSKVEASDEFKAWRKDNQDAYLAHAFVMLEDLKDVTVLEKLAWQVGYYLPKDDMIAVFMIDEDVVSRAPDSEIFKKESNAVDKLDLEKIKFDIREALDKTMDVLDEKYKAHMPDKIIVILQSLDSTQLWNMTVVTRSFHMINIRIDTGSGEVVKETINSIFDLEKKYE